MGLYVRTITPYALPGVLALLACWWFFSRKKDRRSTKPDHISACVNEMETVDALEEILREEVHNSSRAQLLDKEDEIVLQEDCKCSLPLAARESSLYSMQSNCWVDDDLVKESHLKKVGTLQGFADQEVDEIKSPDGFRANEAAEVQEVVGVSPYSVSQTLDGNKVVKHNSATLNDVEKLCTISTEPPCGCSQAGDIQEFPLKEIDLKISFIHDSDLLQVFSQTEALDMPEKKLPVEDVNEIKAEDTMLPSPQANSVERGLVSKEVERNSSEFRLPACHVQTWKVPCDPFIEQNDEAYDLGSAKPCSHREGVEITQSAKTSTVFFKELDVQPSVAEMLVDYSGSHVVQSCQPIEDEIGLAFKGDVKPFETQCSESILSEQVTHDNALDLTTQSHLKAVDSVIACEPSESCVQSFITEVVREGNCTTLLDTFSKCLEKKEETEDLCPVVDDLKEANPQSFLGDYEAKIVEQLAMDLISKVIVAARQEILSSSVSDVSDSRCQILDENRDVLTRDAQSKPLVPGSDEDSVSANFTFGVKDFDCTCESTQFELSQNENFRNTGLTVDEFCLEHQREEKHTTPSTSVCRMPSVSDFSPVQRTDFFEESQPALEDSSLSVCTSEECLNMDDPMQSTVLSTVSIGGYDSLSSSGIGLSRETFNVSIEKTMKATCGENDKELYCNGDIKRGSPDLNHDGPLTTESEVDHSGGSDVNSMDSVDSGYALGNSEQFQNVKQKSDAKKADLVIWEFEVPKYLVGRLIGKQGRFVSFLKQSSGAKIYISTVPYTQDIQICHLEGSQQQIDRALSLIRKKFKDLNLTNIFAPPPPLIPLPVASWLTLPNNVSVEVVVVNVVNAGHMFVQQRTHPTFHALCGLDQHMSLCYSQPGIPTLPTPAEVGILCAAPVGPSVWWRAQVMAYFEDTEEVEILYVDYGGYNRVKINTLRQIRSDFVSLPFQGVEVLLDNVIPLGDEDHFSAEADAAVKELTRGAPMLTQVTNYDEATRLPLVQLWRLNPDEMVSVNRSLVERGFAEWIDGY
ncbi:PREDICTED: A-kinase anchor protein 1, mitochondrial [Nanorana parkeri]|uniref:A-kinase anchor protein 1, mitochondrial n=1 Tax=Nanorana parkeri TaxID=125878 RepID=UPI0008546C31|nr:PREDICTED: A-kinase anchor protein 1, mitochondrial [Nanorana parkeri]